MVGAGSEGDNDLKSFFELETPLREVGLPKNMADAILFLCTTEYLTGSDLNVDVEDLLMALWEVTLANNSYVNIY